MENCSEIDREVIGLINISMSNMSVYKILFYYRLNFFLTTKEILNSSLVFISSWCLCLSFGRSKNMLVSVDFHSKWLYFSYIHISLCLYIFQWGVCVYIYIWRHSSTLAWKIPWMEEPGGLQSTGSLRVRHDWATSLSLFTLLHWRRKWQPTPVFLPGESQGRGSLVGCLLWGRTELDTTEATQQQQHTHTQIHTHTHTFLVVVLVIAKYSNIHKVSVFKITCFYLIPLLILKKIWRRCV